MNNKWLAITLGVLIALFIITKLSNRRTDKSFNPNIIVLDTAAVNKVFVSPKAGDPFTLNKNGGRWQLNLNNKIINADQSTINSLFSNILKVKADRVVTKNQERWKDYEVEGESSTQIELFDQNDKLLGLIIGRFNFDQMSRSATSFIRLADKDEVYAIDGFASMSLSAESSTFRNKQVVKANAADLTTFVLNSSQGTKSLRFDGNQWMNSESVALDSMQVVSYLNSISNVNGMEYDDQFNPEGAQPISQLVIEGNNMLAPIEVTCYKSQNEEHDFVLRSSMNPESYFSSDSSGIYQRVFGKLNELIP